ncbi:MAG TPA: ribosome maturation factor RimP [Chryseosolibacter sp.]|jgi:ribosome maturation factor RimP|nr:ribosome maturation factor RimP [Chryseosolibacter sp.]
MDLVEEIRNAAVRNLSPEKFVVEVVISGKKIPKRVLVIVDGDAGVTIDDCADLSRKLSKEFEDRSFFGEENYILEVSTPGLDQPLKLRRQFQKNIGRKLKVKLQDSQEEGTLMEVTEEHIMIRQQRGAGKKMEEKEIRISFTEIDKAFVLVSFK